MGILDRLFTEKEFIVVVKTNEEFDAVTEKMQSYCDEHSIKVSWASGTKITTRVHEIDRDEIVTLHLQCFYKNRDRYSMVFGTYQDMKEIEYIMRDGIKTLVFPSEILRENISEGIIDIDFRKCMKCVLRDGCCNS